MHNKSSLAARTVQSDKNLYKVVKAIALEKDIPIYQVFNKLLFFGVKEHVMKLKNKRVKAEVERVDLSQAEALYDQTCLE